MDTWHILEQRFHEIGNRDQCLAMTFEDKEDSDKCWYCLEGPPEHYAGNGVWRHVLYGKPMGGAPKTPPILEKNDYSHADLHQTLLRAGRILNLEDGKSDGDWVGSQRFVKLLVQHYGSPVTGLLFKDGDAKFFTNAARVCGMLAGKLAAEKTSITDDPPVKEKPPKNCRASKNDIRKSDFYDKARNKSPQITYSEVAGQWNRTFQNEEQSEQGFRQAVSRAVKARKWQQERDTL